MRHQHFHPPVFLLSIKKPAMAHCGLVVLNMEVSCGAGEDRTPVQTYSPKAFYMLISLLIVGVAPGKNKPMQHLAEWS
jgi:hypothetical protein